MKKDNGEKSLKRVFGFLRLVEKTLYRIIFPYKIHGNTQKYNEGGLIIIGNHYHLIDVAYPLRVTDKPVRFIAKQELWDNGGVSKFFVTKCQCIPAKRDGNDVATVKQSLKILKDGGVINIFPEGTRNKDYDDIKLFHSGASALSIKTQTPIVPIIKIKKIHMFRRADILIGDPIEFRKYYGKRVTREELAACDERLKEAMNNMRLSFIEKNKIKIKNKK